MSNAAARVNKGYIGTADLASGHAQRAILTANHIGRTRGQGRLTAQCFSLMCEIYTGMTDATVTRWPK
jgi:hypothetical protein